MKEKLNITMVQSNLHWENVDANLAMFDKHLKNIKPGSTDLIVLPELFSTGFTMNAERLAETENGKTLSWLKAKAHEKKCVIAGSIIFKKKEKYYNRFIWMRPEGSYESYDKHHLFRYAGEHKHFSAGKKKVFLELNGWKICPLICYDLRFPVWSRNKIKKANKKGNTFDYDVLIYIASWPKIRNHAWKSLLSARAIENQAYVVGVNRIGSDGNNIAYSGDSVIHNPLGEIISKTKAENISIETISLTHAELENWRAKFPAWADADAFTFKE